MKFSTTKYDRTARASAKHPSKRTFPGNSAEYVTTGHDFLKSPPGEQQRSAAQPPSKLSASTQSFCGVVGVKANIASREHQSKRPAVCSSANRKPFVEAAREAPRPKGFNTKLYPGFQLAESAKMEEIAKRARPPRQNRREKGLCCSLLDGEKALGKSREQYSKLHAESLSQGFRAAQLITNDNRTHETNSTLLTLFRPSVGVASQRPESPAPPAGRPQRPASACLSGRSRCHPMSAIMQAYHDAKSGNRSKHTDKEPRKVCKRRPSSARPAMQALSQHMWDQNAQEQQPDDSSAFMHLARTMIDVMRKPGGALSELGDTRSEPTWSLIQQNSQQWTQIVQTALECTTHGTAAEIELQELAAQLQQASRLSERVEYRGTASTAHDRLNSLAARQCPRVPSAFQSSAKKAWARGKAERQAWAVASEEVRRGEPDSAAESLEHIASFEERLGYLSGSDEGDSDIEVLAETDVDHGTETDEMSSLVPSCHGSQPNFVRSFESREIPSLGLTAQ